MDRGHPKTIFGSFFLWLLTFSASFLGNAQFCRRVSCLMKTQTSGSLGMPECWAGPLSAELGLTADIGVTSR